MINSQFNFQKLPIMIIGNESAIKAKRTKRKINKPWKKNFNKLILTLFSHL